MSSVDDCNAGSKSPESRSAPTEVGYMHCSLKKKFSVACAP